MSVQRVIIELSPSRLEVAVLRAGKIAESRSRRFALTDWPKPCNDAVLERLQPLKEILSELGITTAEASLVYALPGSISSVTSLPTSAGVAGAEQAARLALANVADFPLDADQIETTCLLSERPPKNADPAWLPQLHILAAADAEERTLMLCGLLRKAGLTPVRLISADALALADAVSTATAKGDQAVHAVMCMGEHSSVLASGTAGRLLFVRPLGAGTESLVEALCRPLKTSFEAAEGVTLERHEARSILASVGVPSPDQELPGHPELKGSVMLPHLQPCVQRWAVEAKQSLRFGVPEPLRGLVEMRILGAGASVPRLPELLARQIGVPPAAAATGAESSLISAFMRHVSLRVNLLPAELRAAGPARRLRTALIAGVVCAAGLVAIEFATTRAQLSTELASVAKLEAQANQSTDPAQALTRAVSARRTLAGVEDRIQSGMGSSGAWPELLSLLGHTNEPVRLTEIVCESDGATRRAVLRGHIRYATAADAPSAINRFMNELAGMPIVEAARLGGTQRLQIDGWDSQTFELNLTMTPLPGAPPTLAGKEAP